MATSFTIEMVEALRAAIAQGVKRVEFEDKAVTYHSLEEMERLLYKMEVNLGLRKRSTRVYAESDKGLE